MEYQSDRERSLPLFLVMSLAVHALLFLIGPQLVSGILPSLQPGDQGGLTYVTLVDAPLTERPRAAVQAPAQRPEARPLPESRPEPQPSNTPEPVMVPEVPVENAAPTPTNNRPQTVESVVAEPAQPEPTVVAARPEPTAAEEAVQPRPVAQPVQPTPVPVLTSERGEIVVADTTATADNSADPAGATASSAVQGEPRQSVQPPQRTQSVEPLPSGTAAAEDVASAAPDAEIAQEPALPPAGESMVRDFGGSTFPKNAVGLVQGTVTVEVAAIVGADGRVLETVIVDGSGISVVDTHATNVVTHLIPFKPYDDTYEIRIFITFNSDEQSRLLFRYGEFINSPPTVGTYSSDGGR